MIPDSDLASRVIGSPATHSFEIDTVSNAIKSNYSSPSDVNLTFSELKLCKNLGSPAVRRGPTGTVFEDPCRRDSKVRIFAGC